MLLIPGLVLLKAKTIFFDSSKKQKVDKNIDKTETKIIYFQQTKQLNKTKTLFFTKKDLVKNLA